MVAIFFILLRSILKINPIKNKKQRQKYEQYSF